MPVVEQPAPGPQAALPAEVWSVIARATLRAEGDGVRAWERLGRVSRSWRAALAGELRPQQSVHGAGSHGTLLHIEGERCSGIRTYHGVTGDAEGLSAQLQRHACP